MPQVARSTLRRVDTTTTCSRHGTPTRLACSNCGTPICPRCSIETPVGQKCPDCAKLPRRARAQAKPQQYVKGIASGVLAAGIGAFLLNLLFTSSVPFLRWILCGVVGFGIGRAVIKGAEGNRASTLQRYAVVLGVVSVVGGWFIAFGLPPWRLPANITVIGSYLAAAYGAWLAFER